MRSNNVNSFFEVKSSYKDGNLKRLLKAYMQPGGFFFPGKKSQLNKPTVADMM